MECFECGSEMTTTSERVLYAESGIPDLYLDGVEVSCCSSCGNEERAIYDMAGLHRAIARDIAEKAWPLVGEEARFLRKVLEFTGVQMAKAVGVTPETVSRWENNQQPVGPVAERLMRMMALHASAPKPSTDAPTTRVRSLSRSSSGQWGDAA